MNKNFWIMRRRAKAIALDLQEMMHLQGKVYRLYGKKISSIKLEGTEMVFELEDEGEQLKGKKISSIKVEGGAMVFEFEDEVEQWN
jgi:formamidopyrimidine-DNA glycosylase